MREPAGGEALSERGGWRILVKYRNPTATATCLADTVVPSSSAAWKRMFPSGPPSEELAPSRRSTQAGSVSICSRSRNHAVYSRSNRSDSGSTSAGVCPRVAR